MFKLSVRIANKIKICFSAIFARRTTVNSVMFTKNGKVQKILPTSLMMESTQSVASYIWCRNLLDFSLKKATLTSISVGLYQIETIKLLIMIPMPSLLSLMLTSTVLVKKINHIPIWLTSISSIASS